MSPMHAPLWRRLGPVARAGFTSCVIMQAGDVVCQCIQRRKRRATFAWREHDWTRTAQFGLIGLTLHGPFFWWGFGMLDKRFGPAKSLLTAAKKAAFGHMTIFPVYIVAFFSYITLLETRGDLAAAADKVKASFVKTFVAGSLLWPLANMINFRFCPPAARVLYINAVGLLWNAVLSAFNSSALEARTGAVQAVAA